ncbi:hypothetical protein J6590_092084 [Homalodisca vitripennis]|nr:hypothetical protein J6590_092084 [Homalodisca vitripennis]
MQKHPIRCWHDPGTMPGDKQTPTTAHQSIEACVQECLSHAGAVDALAAKLKVVVDEAVQTALECQSGNHLTQRGAEKTKDGHSEDRGGARGAVYAAKKRLKGTGVVVREDLTSRRQEVYRRAVEVHGLRSCWTSDGRVMWVDSRGHKGKATRLADVK